jgi:orotidine-5'-phosphate decarboxylase
VSTSFAQRLSDAVAARESQIVLGIDPDPARLWPAAASAAEGGGGAAERAARAVALHCRLLIEAAGPECVAVKPQFACFERLGAPGWAALAEVIGFAQASGLLAIADAKRGDFPPTAAAYAQALAGSTATLAGEVPGLGADAYTVNPLLGGDSLEPFVASGAGVFVLVRTSNPGAADFQELELVAGGPVWERLAALVDGLGEARECGFSDIGAVIGATAAAHLPRARELMPHTIFLMPGVGAQGGDVQDLAPAFAAGRAGGLPSASRSIADAHRERGGDPADAARAEAERLRTIAWNLAG